MQDNYFEPDLETAPREVLHWIQSRRLVKMVENCIGYHFLFFFF